MLDDLISSYLTSSLKDFKIKDWSLLYIKLLSFEFRIESRYEEF